MLKKQKGITLIALIITIIIMLILVTVTINVALNGGLFSKAEEAETKTQKEADKEKLQIAVIAAYDEKSKKVVGSKLEENLPGWTVSQGDGLWRCTSPNLSVFTVYVSGKITKENEETEKEETGESVPTISTTEDYVGCLADIDGDKEPDGIIYVDLAVGKTSTSEYWGNQEGTYNITGVDVNSLKKYTVVQEGVKDKFRTRRKRCNFCCKRNNRNR